ncbi:hypothetical protein AB0M31_43590 [Streptomyces sp. NPDC051773]|uniref:hypothetical protein n=1 Tax=Streptomyces sp. NPDC051773 TaxID=3156682 RepID=UPI003435AE20
MQQTAAALEAAARTAGLRGAQRKGIDEAVNYLTGKAEHLRYDTALERGWPIATGIIEGACRHLVKDRLDITGARWGLSTAEAVLKLRSVRANGDFDTYWAWHQQQEFIRNPDALPRPGHTHRLIYSTLIGSAPISVCSAPACQSWKLSSRQRRGGFVADHSSEARNCAHLADEELAQVSDPGQRATAYALLALTHAVLSTGEGVSKISSTLWEMEDVFRG